jgi:hypothetical protein
MLRVATGTAADDRVAHPNHTVPLLLLGPSERASEGSADDQIGRAARVTGAGASASASPSASERDLTVTRGA